MTSKEDEDATITEADLAEARARWAGRHHEAAAPDIFSQPVYGDGFRGDLPFNYAGEAPPGTQARTGASAYEKGAGADLAGVEWWRGIMRR